MIKHETKYMNPYLAGFGLGLVLLLTFLITGHGIGVSGALNRAMSNTLAVLTGTHATFHDYFSRYISGPGLLGTWVFVEVIGVYTGGWLSARLAGRAGKEIVKGPGVSDRRRKLFAIGGGALVGVGSRLGRGCTSGQALTGGALLNGGSWLFMIMIFVGGYLVARLLRREWY